MRVEGMGVKGKEKKVRSDKKIRICPYFDQELLQKLNRLARIVGVTDSQLLLEMAQICLEHPNIINYIQDKHGLKEDDPFRTHPTYIDGKLVF